MEHLGDVSQNRLSGRGAEWVSKGHQSGSWQQPPEGQDRPSETFDELLSASNTFGMFCMFLRPLFPQKDDGHFVPVALVCGCTGGCYESDASDPAAMFALPSRNAQIVAHGWIRPRFRGIIPSAALILQRLPFAWAAVIGNARFFPERDAPGDENMDPVVGRILCRQPLC